MSTISFGLGPERHYVGNENPHFNVKNLEGRDYARAIL